MKPNKEWHDAHVLPKNPSMADRIFWHAEHAKACGCRPIPESVRAAMRVDQRDSIHLPK